MNAARYSLMYNSTIIVTCLDQTYKQYGDTISALDFDAMINCITKGGEYNSILARRHDPSIITKICTQFPKYLNTQNIDNLVKSMTRLYYPQSCIKSILDTGYIFTPSQIYTLSSHGYMMLEFQNTLSYDEFLNLFNSTDFINEFKNNLFIDDSSYGYELCITEKINRLKDICKKYDVKLKSNFVSVILNKIKPINCRTHELYNIIRNVHIIGHELGMTFEREEFEMIVKTYDFYNGTDVNKIKLITRFYGDTVIDRKFILDNLENDSIFISFLHPTLTDYNPLSDIFYIIFAIPNMCRFRWIMCMLEEGYIVINNFCLFLMYIRTEHDDTQLTKILDGYINENIDKVYIENIFTFGSSSSINFLSTQKILPSLDYLTLCTSLNTLKKLRNTSMFLDDEEKLFIDNIIKFDTYNNCKVICSDFSDAMFLDIYDTLNERDKEIALRIPYSDIINVATIIRYRITVTRKMIEYKFARNQWYDFVSLMYLSREYDYLIEMIDTDNVTIASSYMARQWLMNNIINNRPKTFALPNNLFELRTYVDEDVKTLLTQPIINNIDEIRQTIVENEERITREILVEHLKC